MYSIITWIACGLAALLSVACVVAWYEHLGRRQQRNDDDWETPPRRAASVDIELDALAAEPAWGDVGERRQALGGAISRMARGDRRQGVGDTVPMILAGPSTAPQAGGPPRARRERERDRATAGD